MSRGGGVFAFQFLMLPTGIGPRCVCGHLMGNVKAPACLSWLLYSSVAYCRMLHRIIVAQLLTRHSSLSNYKLEALGDRKIADPTKFLQLALTQL